MASVATGGTLFITFSGVVTGPALFGVLASLSGGYRLAYAMLALPALACALLLRRGSPVSERS
jgi:MFS family permease